MKRVRLIEHAPLTKERVTTFKGERDYLATGSVSDNGSLEAERVTFESRPTRANLSVRPGDVAFARMQGTRKVLEITPETADVILSTGFAVLRPNQKLMDSGFLRRWLDSGLFQAQKDRLCTGATQKAITNSKIEHLRIPFPPLAEQKRIAAILDAADELRAKRRDSIDQLDMLRQSAFFDMFGDPVTNPKGWERQSMGRLCDFRSGYAWKSKHFNQDGIGSPVIRIQNVGTDSSDLVYTSEEPIERFWVEPGEYLLSLSGSFRLAAWAGPRSLLNQRIVKLTPLSSLVPTFFATAVSQQLSAIEAMGRHALVNNVALSDLKKLELSVPPIEIQRRFGDIVDSLEQQKTRAQVHLEELETLFESLQSRAFRGEL